MDPVIVSPISTIGSCLAVIGGGAALAALILSEQRNLCLEIRSLSERVSDLDRRLSGLERRLAWLEGAFPVAFALSRRVRPAPSPEFPKTDRDESVTRREHR